MNTEQNFTISPRFIFRLLILVAVVWLAVRLTDVLIEKGKPLPQAVE